MIFATYARTRTTRVLLMGLVVAVAALIGASRAHASTPGSWWRLNATVAPTLLPAEGEVQLNVTASDLGYGEVNTGEGSITLTDELPPHVEPTAVYGGSVLVYGSAGELKTHGELPCSYHEHTVTCTFKGRLAPYGLLQARIVATVEDPAKTPLLPNVVKLTGPEASSPQPLETALALQQANGEKPPFGLSSYELTPEDVGGVPDTEAGSHPFQMSTLLDFNQTLEHYAPPYEEGYWASVPALPRNLRFKLPPGLVGDASAVPRCTGIEFSSYVPAGNLCPQDTAVGVATVTVFDPLGLGGSETVNVPVFNLEPGAGEPARFGFVATTGGWVPVVLKTAVPSGGEYAVEVRVEDISQAVQVLSSVVTLWGVPGDPRHDESRGWGCLLRASETPCEPFSDPTPKAFLTLPTSCAKAPATSVSGESWPAGNVLAARQLAPEHTEYRFPSTLTGCSSLEFDPSISVEPESHSASTPTGLNVGVEMPQPGLLALKGRAESALEQTTVRLPPGLQLNPSAANALEDCAASEFDFLNLLGNPFGFGKSSEYPEEELQTENETSPSGPAHCPDAAKVGTVQIFTPLLSQELTGSVYLAAQNTSPFKSPLALYLVAEDPEAGVRVKLAGSVVVEPDGQLVSTFSNTPQVPFTSLKLHLFGGERAPQSTPSTCGPATTTSEFVPWSEQPAAHPESTFQITSGVKGGSCPPSPLSFSPSFAAGPTSAAAGAFSSFVMHLYRPDGQQALSGLTLHLPPGFAAVLASVTPCQEPAAGQEWACGEESHIGEARETAGLGEEAEAVTLTGQAYLTTGYHGAPFGLLVRTHAAAGPFDLGWVNVRSRINVDPNTAAVTVTTNSGPGGEAVPTILDGVPVQLKTLEVAVNRPSFEFNPTSCNTSEVTGTLDGSEGAAFGVSDPFKAEGCPALPFHPALEASTEGQASKAGGASLTVKVTSQGLGVANIAKTKLTLPAALPSRLTTIQQACPDAVFESTPATPGSACDEGSQIGRGVAHTPVLKSPLEGPAYLVSHGGAEFPDVEFVLKGEGILLVLDGKTDIKHGITTSTFESVPDAPVESFEAILPAGPHSALATNIPESDHYDQCGEKLTMPTVITGQNGAVIEQETNIAITGCSEVKGSTIHHPSLAQQFAAALGKCRSSYKHSRSKRAACERRADSTYTAIAIAACRKGDEHSHSKRAACEAQARQRYDARSASRGHASARHGRA